MSVHVFTVSEENFQICIDHGIVAIPEPKEDSRNRNNIFDGLASRLAGVKEDDYVLMYVTKPAKQLRGVWQVEGVPFYEETHVWPDRLYPFRCRIRWSPYSFTYFLSIDDVNDLCNSGKIWTWSLKRATGSNSMFSISDNEFQILLTEFAKINPFSTKRGIIRQPHPYHDANIIKQLHITNNKPKYEFTVMALLSSAFSKKSFTDIFGDYSDFLCYVPTNLGKEMDFLLMYANPAKATQIVSFDIIEVKLDEFDEVALRQLISYESWFLQKKVSGDSNMVRSTAIAKSFSDDVIDYVSKRSRIENKPIKLLTYSYENECLTLAPVNS